MKGLTSPRLAVELAPSSPRLSSPRLAVAVPERRPAPAILATAARSGRAAGLAAASRARGSSAVEAPGGRGDRVRSTQRRRRPAAAPGAMVVAPGARSGRARPTRRRHPTLHRRRGRARDGRPRSGWSGRRNRGAGVRWSILYMVLTDWDNKPLISNRSGRNGMEVKIKKCDDIELSSNFLVVWTFRPTLIIVYIKPSSRTCRLFFSVTVGLLFFFHSKICAFEKNPL